ncbi:RNA polymerase sigma factor [Paenibacillus mendelii]|uniref:RNA polymerase sigma factor n=1 Tax=Paenibacillus mendelii TaxID=206163 RepID=A0ABV6J6F6_9BACL|nr:sigma-70 family RNA polymerase sigma factor [Paenibacillus mendelii]MCQ6561165.1 sigma-70 family RNA polymerase sigma factor [Paenibacillus mendelii]
MRAREEFEDVVKPHFNRLWTYCLYLTPSQWEAEDLFQDSLLRAFQHYRKIGAFHHPRSLLYKIARNLSIDAYRKNRGVLVPLEEGMQNAYHDPNYAAARGLMEWLTDHLSEREVDMLLLAEWYGYSYQEIAQHQGCTIPAVKMVLHRSKQRLRNRADIPYESGTTRTQREDSAMVNRQAATVERWTRVCISMGERQAAAASRSGTRPM